MKRDETSWLKAETQQKMAGSRMFWLHFWILGGSEGFKTCQRLFDTIQRWQIMKRNNRCTPTAALGCWVHGWRAPQPQYKSAEVQPCLHGFCEIFQTMFSLHLQRGTATQHLQGYIFHNYLVSFVIHAVVTFWFINAEFRLCLYPV